MVSSGITSIYLGSWNKLFECEDSKIYNKEPREFIKLHSN